MRACTRTPGRQAGERERPDERAGEREHAVEGPDAPRRAKSLARRRAERAQQLARRAAQVGERPARSPASPATHQPQLAPGHLFPVSSSISPNSLRANRRPTSEAPLQLERRSRSFPTSSSRSHQKLPPQDAPDQRRCSDRKHPTRSYPTSWSRSTFRPTSSRRRPRGQPSPPSRTGMPKIVLLALEHDAVHREVCRRRATARASRCPVDHWRPLWASARRPGRPDLRQCRAACSCRARRGPA